MDEKGGDGKGEVDLGIGWDGVGKEVIEGEDLWI